MIGYGEPMENASIKTCCLQTSGTSATQEYSDDLSAFWPEKYENMEWLSQDNFETHTDIHRI